MRFLSAIPPWRGRQARPGRRKVRRVADWRRRRRWTIVAGTGLILLGLGWLGASGWFGRQLDQAGQRLLAATAQAGFGVDDVLVEGRYRTQRSAILKALGLARGQPILGFDPHAAKQRLEALPWVRQATVERRLPGVVFVSLIERQPLALWQNGDRLTVIDSVGEIVPAARPEVFAGLPVLVGREAPKHAPALLAMLDSEPELRLRVAAAVWVRGRRWNVRLDGGIDVRLPEDDAAAAWAQLGRIQRAHSVLERDVVAIDLRVPDRLIVRTSPDATWQRGSRHSGEDT